MPPKSSSATRSQLPPKSSSPSGFKKTYLLTYNLVSTSLWLGVLVRVLQTAGRDPAGVWENGSAEVFAKHDRFLRGTQTLAVMEVLHSLFGIVRAPLLTTVMQIASRILLVWGIAYPFPASTSASPAYTTMLLAWSVTEVIRYSYFVFVLRGAGVPGLWTWLRYNTFLVLYPMGISSECWLVYKAMEPAGRWRKEATWGLAAVLAIYVPGSYILFTHMLKQRRRIMSGKGKPE